MTTEIPRKMKDCLLDEGVVAIVTQGEKGPHVVNTWNSYLTLTEDNRMLIPASRMFETEKNLKADAKVQLTLGSRAVRGFNSLGTGFLITGSARLEHEGSLFLKFKDKFPWLRAVLVVTPEAIEQTL